jgi:hypothetical protein
MLVVETIARIRREHFIKGKTIKEIARDLKVSRNTVRKVLRSGETSFEYERLVQPRPKLGRWASELDGLLSANATKHIADLLIDDLAASAGRVCRDGLKIGGEASGARRGEPRCLIPPEFVPAPTERAFTPKSPTRS